MQKSTAYCEIYSRQPGIYKVHFLSPSKIIPEHGCWKSKQGGFWSRYMRALSHNYQHQVLLAHSSAAVSKRASSALHINRDDVIFSKPGQSAAPTAVFPTAEPAICPGCARTQNCTARTPAFQLRRYTALSPKSCLQRMLYKRWEATVPAIHSEFALENTKSMTFVAGFWFSLIHKHFL